MLSKWTSLIELALLVAQGPVAKETYIEELSSVASVADLSIQSVYCSSIYKEMIISICLSV